MKLSIVIMLILGFGSCQLMEAGYFLYSNGVYTDLNTPGNFLGDYGASGFNNAGQIVGTYVSNSGIHGFVNTNGVITTIDAPGAGVETYAYGINNVGQIVGTYYDRRGLAHGYVDTNGVFTTIDAPGVLFTFLYGINDGGQLVGNTDVSGGKYGGAFLYSNGVFTAINGVDGETARGINNAGQVVLRGGLLFSNGVVTPITSSAGLHAYSANGINNLGQIVGESSTGQGYVLDTSNRTVTYLNFPGAGSTEGIAINDSGQIVGSYAPTPEPASLLLFAIGLAGIGCVVRRRS